MPCIASLKPLRLEVCNCGSRDCLSCWLETATVSVSESDDDDDDDDEFVDR